MVVPKSNFGHANVGLVPHEIHNQPRVSFYDFPTDKLLKKNLR